MSPIFPCSTIEVGLRPDAGAEEQIGDVFQANFMDFGDQVFAVAVSVEAARDADFGVSPGLERERGVVVLECERTSAILSSRRATRSRRRGRLPCCDRGGAWRFVRPCSSESRRRCSIYRSRSDLRCRGRRRSKWTTVRSMNDLNPVISSFLIFIDKCRSRTYWPLLKNGPISGSFLTPAHVTLM